jgi:hypothetical protein
LSKETVKRNEKGIGAVISLIEGRKRKEWEME